MDQVVRNPAASSYFPETGCTRAIQPLPTDTTFYDLFGKSAGHLVQGAQLLTEMDRYATDEAQPAC